ncbi:MAG: hypothetical protein ACYSU1_04770 [Planctomycetota bacterium]|jgi:hypothetical protein
MDLLTVLWFPVLVSAAGVFVASSIIHMLLPIHKKDYEPVPGEEEVLEVMRKHGLKPGSYMFPACNSMKDLENPEMVARFEKGPVGFMSVKPSGMPTMGKALLLWFLLCVGINGCLAAVIYKTTGAAAPPVFLFQVFGVLATVAYGAGAAMDSIWKAQPWSVAFRFLFDGIVYGLTTAGVMAWLWPEF